MAASGCETPEALAAKAGVDVALVQALLDNDPSKVDSVSMLKIRTATGFAPMWILFSDGPPGSGANPRPTPDELWHLEQYRQLTPHQQQAIDAAISAFLVR